mmetsp:Transcript_20465/g.62302  ORF Transcript_20465/g.62302 Transcript_20465/m.62302 type:complete len:607 (+) Transcript_20465:191-2011(+)
MAQTETPEPQNLPPLQKNSLHRPHAPPCALGVAGIDELRVDPPHRHELGVLPLLHDAAAVHHADDVAVFDGGEAVGDHDRGETRLLDELVERLLHDLLGLAVQRRRGLVQEQDARVVHQRARDRDALLLAAAEAVAAVPDVRVVALGERGDEAVRVRLDGGLLDLLVGERAAAGAHGDVVLHAAAEEHGLLAHEPDGLVEPPVVQLVQGLAVQRHGAAVGVVEAHRELDGRALAAAAGAHEAHGDAGLDVQRVALADLLVRAAGVGEVHVVQGDAAAAGRGLLAALVLGVDLRRPVQEAEDVVHGLAGLLGAGDVLAGRAQAEDREEHREHGHQEVVEGEVHVLDEPGAPPEEQGVVEELDGDAGAEGVALLDGLPHEVVELAQGQGRVARHESLLEAQGGDGAHRRDGLADDGAGLGGLPGGLVRRAEHDGHLDVRGEAHERDGADGHERERPAVHERDHDARADAEHDHHDLLQGLAGLGLDQRGVGGQAARHRADGVLGHVEVPRLLPEQRVEHDVAHAAAELRRAHAEAPEHHAVADHRRGEDHEPPEAESDAILADVIGLVGQVVVAFLLGHRVLAGEHRGVQDLDHLREENAPAGVARAR